MYHVFISILKDNAPVSPFIIIELQCMPTAGAYALDCIVFCRSLHIIVVKE